MRHPAKHGYSVNASRSDLMCADADMDTANRIATCSDSKCIRTRNAPSIHRSDVDTWVFASSVAWQSFEVIPNVIGPTSTTCE